MFTGIVKEVGRVATRDGASLHIETAISAPIGASIAVNGACLTVTGAGADSFAADLVEETLARTNLGRLEPGQEVNLEPPLTLQQPLDGHLVLGHVDATAQVLEAGQTLRVELPAELAAYVAEKGSIAVDGTSLTVAGVDEAGRSFSVALIPTTLRDTIAGTYAAGTLVNLEIDVMARYAERQRQKDRER